MAMISGPYTDEIVKMLMGEERRLLEGDVLKNPCGQYGVFDGKNIWISDPVVRLISAEEFDAIHSKKLMFPEPFAGGYRFVRGDGNIWIPELSPEEKDFLKHCGYQPVSAPETVARMARDQGEHRFPCYPLSCKTGIRQEKNILQAVSCFERFGD
ncbi:MAG: hypothetical protein ACI3W6_08880 [Clostridia bacterium]